MLLPHFDRPITRPPDGPFEINHRSPQLDGLMRWLPSLAGRGGDRAPELLLGGGMDFNGSIAYSPSLDAGFEFLFPTTGSPYGLIELDTDFGTKGTLVFGSVFANFGTNDGNFYLFDTQSTRSTLLKNSGSNTYTFLLHGNLLSQAGAILELSDYTDLVITWDNDRSADRIRIFSNGDQSYTNNTSLTAYTATDIYIGTRFSIQEFWRGGIGEIRIYDFAWEAERAWDFSHNRRWDLYLPVQRIWPVMVAVVGGQPTQKRSQGIPTASGYRDRPGRWN